MPSAELARLVQVGSAIMLNLLGESGGASPTQTKLQRALQVQHVVGQTGVVLFCTLLRRHSPVLDAAG